MLVGLCMNLGRTVIGWVPWVPLWGVLVSEHWTRFSLLKYVQDVFMWNSLQWYFLNDVPISGIGEWLSWVILAQILRSFWSAGAASSAGLAGRLVLAVGRRSQLLALWPYELTSLRVSNPKENEVTSIYKVSWPGLSSHTWSLAAHTVC